MTEIYTFCEQTLSCGSACESGNDDLSGDAASGGNGATAKTGQIMAVAMGDFLDQAELAQTPKVTGHARHGEIGQEARQIGTANALDVELRTLQGAQRRLLRRIEEVETLEGMAVDDLGAGESMQVAITCRRVVESGQVFQVAPVTAEQNLAQIDEAVDGLPERGDFVGFVVITMFPLAVVFEAGHVVGSGFQAQDAMELVVHLDRYLTEAVLDTGTFDAGGQATADFLCQLRCHLLAQETRHLLGLDREDRLPGEFLVERLDDLFGAKHPISRVFNLHQTPLVGLAGDIEHRAALLGIAVQDRVQGVWREAVGKLLGTCPVADTNEGIVSHRVVYPFGFERTRQPTVAITVELKPERTARRDTQGDESESFVDPVEIIVEALARGMAQKGLVSLLVVLRFVGVAGFHRGEEMHQPRGIARVLEHCGNDLFLADRRLGNVLDSRSVHTRQRLCGFMKAITQRLGQTRVVNNADVIGIKETRHPRRITGARLGSGNHYPVVARRHSCKPFLIPISQHFGHGRHLHLLSSVTTTTSSCLVPASPA